MRKSSQLQPIAEPKRYQELQFPITRDNVRQLLRRYAIEPESISVPKSGIENTTLIIASAGNSCVLRIYRQNKKTTSAIKQEVAFMRYLAANGIPVPPVITNTNGEDVTEVSIKSTVWQCLMMTFIDGHHPATYTNLLISQMAHIQAQTHLLGENYRRTLPSAQLNYVSPRAIYSVMADLILPKGPCHMDFTVGNILVRNGQISAVLDFDDMKEAPVVDCLAASIKRLIRDTNGSRRMALYLEAYQQVRQLTGAEKQRLYERLFIRPRVIQAIGKFF